MILPHAPQAELIMQSKFISRARRKRREERTGVYWVGSGGHEEGYKE
jgi:hypothetical protein